MRDAGGEAPDRLHLLGLDELELGGLQLGVGVLEFGEGRLQFPLAAGQLGVRLLQLFLGELALGDVAPDADQPNHPALGVAQRHLGGGVPTALARAVDDRLFVIEQRLAGGEDLLVVGGITRGQLDRKSVV